jgi:predicted ATPase/class 3 adenylate cyclase
MVELPAGTITFLFTDIEGSTARWERHPQRMQKAVARHDTLLRTLMAEHHGYVFKTVGDAFYVVFSSAIDAVSAALAAQQALCREPWDEHIRPFRVRMALHTGEAEQREQDYFGPALNRVARILSAGHGGQILLSRTILGGVRSRVGKHIAFRELGMHYLKDIRHPVQIFQVLHPDLPADFPPLKTLNIRPNNLPAQRTPCVGREQELAALSTLLLNPQIRLLTLTGPGGMGKTRLGLQLASNLADSFPDGVWFVELGTVHAAEAIGSAILQVVGLYETGNQSVFEHVKICLDGQTLLFLDGFEQVGQASAFVADLLDACPRLKILVTSRLELELGREYSYPVRPLALPRAPVPQEPEELLAYGAIAHFVQQAQLAQPDFRLTPTNAAVVVKICARLDGLPLALELVAARIVLFSLQMILRRLDRQLQFFATGGQRRSTQQQTLQGIVEWSYSLLDPQEKTLLNRLAVFRGSSAFEAVEAVCALGDECDVNLLGTLKSLTEKSLLCQQESTGGEPRFRIMYIVREYALERLGSGQDFEELSRRHAEYYLGLAEEIAPTLTGLEQKSSLAILEEEQENLQAAFAWFVAHQHIASGLRLAEALGRFWWMRGHLREGRQWLEKLFTAECVHTVNAPLRVRTLVIASRMASAQNDYLAAAHLADQAFAAGQVSMDQESTGLAYIVQAEVAFHRGLYQQATTFLEKSLAIHRELADTRGIASLLNNLGNVALQQDLLEQANRFQEESLELFRQVGDSWAIATVLTSLGEVERRRQNYRRAVIFYEESLRICRTLEYTEGVAISLVSLGDLMRYQGDHSQATRLYKESLVLFRERGEKVGITVCLQGLAEIAYLHDEPERATRLFAQAEVTAYAMNTNILEYEQATHRDTIERLRATLDLDSFEGIWTTGQAMTLEQATIEALGEEGSEQQ